MSKFLGPIHFWVYNKIKFQDELVNNLMKKKGDYNFSESLEDVIDEENIHAWLEKKVSYVEKRLAISMKTIQKNNLMDEKELKDFFYNYGKNKSISLKTSDECFKNINDLLLDGMPCDKAYTISKSIKDSIILKRNICVHNKYYEEIGENISLYYQLRKSLIDGLLSKSDYIYNIIDENTSEIKKGVN